MHRYSNEQAENYDARRLTHARGKAVDAVEWWCLRRALARLERTCGPLHTLLDVLVGMGRMTKRLGARGFEVTGLEALREFRRVVRRGAVVLVPR